MLWLFSIVKMETTQVNWDLLDALVLNYSEEEKLLVSDNDGSFSEGYMLRSIIQEIRSLIEDGYITKALNVIRKHAAGILDDNRLNFCLHKQEFVELLRNGNHDTRSEAINHSRTQLGPCALNAYPEAYEEFKRVLLALIYDEHDKSSPVALEWSEGRREELAATVSSILKAHLHAYDPPFSLMLCYLLKLHDFYCLRQGVVSPIADTANELLSKDRDPPTIVQIPLFSTPNFSENDVQALAQAVDISRQAAVDNLRFTNGDLNTAMKNELSRMRLNVSALDELVREYCIYRGLLDEDWISVNQILTCGDEQQLNSMIDSIGSTDSQERYIEEEATVMMPTHLEAMKSNFSRNFALRRQHLGAIAPSSPIVPESEGEVIQSGIFHSNEPYTLEHRNRTNHRADVRLDCKERYCGENSSMAEKKTSIGTESNRDCSECSNSNSALSDPFNSGISALRSTSSSYPGLRWKGRCLNKPNGQSQSSTGAVMSCKSPPSVSIMAPCSESFPCDVFSLSSNKKYEKAFRIRKLFTERMAKETIEEIKGLLPNFFEQNPYLFFQLKQLEFFALVTNGDLASAIQVARSDLGPVAAKFSEFVRPLKETLLALVKPKDKPSSNPPFPTLISSLQVALNSHLGIIEPKLMKIMKVALFMHTEWFKLQRCSDPFGELLKINALKEIEPRASTTSRGESSVQGGVSCSQIAGTPVSSRPSEGSITQQSDSPQEQVLLDESSILTISEWLALSRADAIQLLARYDGDVDSVFEHLMT